MLFFIANETLAGLGITSSGVIKNQEKLRSLDLFELVGDIPSEHLSYSEIQGGGPDGQGGVLLGLAAAGVVAAARWSPERQSWRQVSHAVWIATDRDPKSGAELVPRPEDLERPCSLSTENVLMVDGSIWEVPVIREPVSGQSFLPPDLHDCRLPKSFYRGIDGVWQAHVTAEYRDLWNQSTVLFQKMIDSEPVMYVEAFQFVLSVLALRYRFNVLVHSRWPEQWLSTKNVMDVVRAAVGWNIVERMIEGKKKAVIAE